MTENTTMDEWAVMEQHFCPPKQPEPPRDLTKCMDCKIELTLDKEGYICSQCGYATVGMISTAAEWRSGPSTDGSAPKQASRCGAPGSNGLYSDQLGTLIRGKYPGFRTKLGKLHLRSINSKDRCLFHAYKHFEAAQREHGVPSSIVNRAKIIYKGISEKTLTRGDKRKGLMGNCLLQSFTENNVPRTTKEVAAMFKIDVKDITRMRNVFFEFAGEIVKTATSEDLMSRTILGFNFDLKLRMKALKYAGRHLDIVKKSKRLSGKTPSGIMAAVLWSVMKKLEVPLCEEDVARASGVSTPTMVKLFHLIQDLF